jgi:uncharacterized alkaline shock family protein YloU
MTVDGADPPDGAAPPAARPATTGAPAKRQRAEPAERGRLHIASLVLRKIAEHTADSSPDTAAPARRGGRNVRNGRNGQRGASARVRTDGPGVDIELDVALLYPQRIVEAAQRLRAGIAQEVNRLTGRRVRRVGVTVVGLRPESTQRVR